MGQVGQVVYLLRHCQATGQVPDAPLTPMGEQQARALVDWFGDAPIGRIVSSPFVRAQQSVVPLARQRRIPIQVDQRLGERVLSSTPLPDWQQRLAATFMDLELCFEGGESSQTAMMRGVAVLHELRQQADSPAVVVTHGNLMALILKYFNPQMGYAEWQSLQNPDLYYVEYNADPGAEGIRIERISKPIYTSS